MLQVTSNYHTGEQPLFTGSPSHPRVIGVLTLTPNTSNPASKSPSFSRPRKVGNHPITAQTAKGSGWVNLPCAAAIMYLTSQ